MNSPLAIGEEVFVKISNHIFKMRVLTTGKAITTLQIGDTEIKTPTKNILATTEPSEREVILSDFLES